MFVLHVLVYVFWEAFLFKTKEKEKGEKYYEAETSLLIGKYLSGAVNYA